jgi:cytoskeletal protein CcmA (bactofilin family)
MSGAQASSSPIRNRTPLCVQRFESTARIDPQLFLVSANSFMGMPFASRNRVEGASMNAMSLIGRTISIKGEVMSEEPLTIAGHVDGSVEAAGYVLTIAEGGRATATLLADTIVVGGAVEGSLCANDKIVVSETAVIEGDLTAPGIRVADGAQVQGRIDTGNRRPGHGHVAT